MGSFHLLLLLLTFFSHFIPSFSSPIIQAAIHQHPKAYYNCTNDATFAANSTYRSNIKTLLDRLSSNVAGNPPISYNTTVASKNTAHTVYGFSYCRTILTTNICQECVIETGKLLLSLCTMAKEAIIWNGQGCYVRYSNRYFFSTVEESPKLTFADDHNYEGHNGRFNTILFDLLNDLRTRAANASNKYSYMEVKITEDEKELHGSAFCAPYLSTENCNWCLDYAIAEVTTVCCKGKSGGTVLYPSCSAKFELYPYGLPPSLPSSTHPSAQPGFVAMFIPH
ncbi:hypothetical protein RIF29_22809 [Crotalaria pallida]|uniref:Gnk2-homologous domain-containing protein n=1 Tax=Crotalaria pallida TaxID=3830 RepID=A0AAN9I9L1_CROPI